jgi:hypothetical protein
VKIDDIIRALSIVGEDAPSLRCTEAAAILRACHAAGFVSDEGEVRCPPPEGFIWQDPVSFKDTAAAAKEKP